MHILVCIIEGQRYAFDLEKVERSLLAIEITPIPNAPKHILGAINIHDQIIPVISMRALLGLPFREVDIDDHFIICHSHQKRIALWVDRVKTVRLCAADELIPAEEIMTDPDAIQFAIKDEDEITLMIDFDRMIEKNAFALNV